MTGFLPVELLVSRSEEKPSEPGRVNSSLGFLFPKEVVGFL
jgi:hypothetical protein